MQPKRERPDRVDCENCGTSVMVQARGPIPTYCSNACQLQAMKLRKGQVGVWMLSPERPIDAPATRAFPINVWDEGKKRYVTMWRTKYPEDRTQGIPTSMLGTVAPEWREADGGHGAIEPEDRDVARGYSDLYSDAGDSRTEAGESTYSAVTDRPRRRGKRQVGDVTRELGMNLGYRRSRIPTMAKKGPQR